VKNRELLKRLATVSIAIGAVILGATQVSAHAFVTGTPTLTTQVRGGGFDTAPVGPGGAPATELVDVSYHGPATTTAAGLYLANYVSRGSSSGPLCTATSPGDEFILTVTKGDQVLFTGSLDSFSALHSTPKTALSLPGGDGVAGQWASGDSGQVSLSIGLDRTAGNSYMECSPNTQFSWFIEL